MRTHPKLSSFASVLLQQATTGNQRHVAAALRNHTAFDAFSRRPLVPSGTQNCIPHHVPPCYTRLHNAKGSTHLHVL